MPELGTDGPAAGWYPDPSRPSRLRYWDADWTGWVHEDGAVVERPLPPRTGIRVWPARVVWTCILWVLVFGVAGGIAYGMTSVITDDAALLLAITLPFQYGGMFVAMQRISRRHGSGDVRRDLTWRIERRDIWPGIGLALMALVVTAVGIAIVRVVLDLDTEGARQFGALEDSSQGRAIFVVLAVVLAPIFEEALFRGVVLHALLRPGPWFGVVASSALFAATHLSLGVGDEFNVMLFSSTLLTGSVLAIGALRTDRLGPSMIAHALFNALVVWATLTTAT